MDTRQHTERKFWDRMARYYDPFIHRAMNDTYAGILKNIADDLEPSQRVLEIGTGTGIIPFAVCGRVSSITGTDISPEMIGVAREKLARSGIGNIEFSVQDSYALEYPDGHFDAVIASNILHLLVEPVKAVGEALRVLNKNGILIAPTFCAGETIRSRIVSRVMELSGFRIMSKWSIGGFTAFLEANGLRILKEIEIKGKMPLAYVVGEKK